MANSIHEEVDEEKILYLVAEYDDASELLSNLELLKDKAREYRDAVSAALYRAKDRSEKSGKRRNAITAALNSARE